MTDVIFNSNVEQYKKRLKDMGDGTYAEVVYVADGTGDGGVESVNGQTGPDVVLTATDVGAKSESYQPTWNDVTDKPDTFPPVAGAAVADAVDEDIVAQFNALLASLRANGAIAT